MVGQTEKTSCRVRFLTGSCVGESPSWSRHRILIPTCEGSSPSSPAKHLQFTSPLPFPESDAERAVLFNTVLFTGNSNPVLAQEMARHLGVELGKAHVRKFSEGEVTVELQQNVRARYVFVVQS